MDNALVKASSSWVRNFGQSSYPQGTASLTMGLQTSLLRGQDHLIYKGPFPHKFRPREPCYPTPAQALHLNRKTCQFTKHPSLKIWPS
ncbi:hypothetical protein DPMN_002727 [Dreissena polymorpha]|uniref:Uncharacterized protein n=1 Tax=Dreissena polymorpha TaxID=45954 RepID=A0A9D4MJP2_DREPO|nr:hypothetical protein DPMN_002727 [Dreissena polymorpha]